MLLQLGRLPEAEDACRRLLSDRTNGIHSQCLLGAVLEARGRPAEAARCYLEADRLSRGMYPPSIMRLQRLRTEHPHIADEVPGVRERLAKEDFSAWMISKREPDVL
jgi:hypothetical protein